MRTFLVILMSFILGGCVGIPKGVQPVKEFDIRKYQGKWYEIARLDHSFERGMSGVSAEYSMRDDGGVKVINRGFSVPENRWKEAEGKGYFVGPQDEGYLKVSFFGPFYGAYAVFELDQQDYQYAFVAGNSTSYLWLLSRTPTVSKAVMDRFIKRAKELGFDTNALIFVDHTPAAATPANRP